LLLCSNGDMLPSSNDINNSILDVARCWIENQSKLQSFANKIRNSQIKNKDFLEEKLIQKINACAVDGSFCAVDGSIACEELHGLDVALYRSVATCFVYENSNLKSVKYFPNTHPPLEVRANSLSSQFEKMRFISLVRLKSELDCALNSVQKFSANYLLLDGSIAPLMDDKPANDSILTPIYEELIEVYKNLYSTCISKNCTLIGITKDSRSSKFYDLISDSLEQNTQNREQNKSSEHLAPLKTCSDTVFLDHLLEKNERTCAFRSSNTGQKNQVFNDLGDFSSNIVSFYIKPVEHDRPLRVEFLSSSQSFSQIANLLCILCSLNEHYAYPAILIEADLRVALDPNEVDQALNDLSSRIGLKQPILKLRRNNRPFR